MSQGIRFISGLAAAGLLLAAAPPATAKDKPIELRVGNEPWRVVLAAPGMKKAEGAPSRPGRQIYTFQNTKTFTMLSVIVEDAQAPATMASCRDVHERRAKALPSDIRSTEKHELRGEAEFQEYTLALPVPGEPILQHHVHNCRIKGNYYIDAHASKLRYKPADRDALVAVLDAVTIVE